MIKTAPHSPHRCDVTVPSDVMYKKYKRLICTHPDLLARFSKVNLSNVKIRPDLFSKNLFSTPNLP